MENITCDRCGRDFKKMDNLRRHLERLYSCKALLADIPLTELRMKYAPKKGSYSCENCGKVYKTASGKCKHKKHCLAKAKQKDQLIEYQTKIIQGKESLLKEALDTILEEQESRKKLEQQVKALLARDYVQNITHNNYIIINSFGEENLDYLTQDHHFLKKCIESPLLSVQKYLDYVHFNKEHPENTNIKLTNLQSPFMDYFKNGIWNKVEQRVMIPRIISKSVKVINEIMSSQDEEEEKEQIWYKYVNELKDNNIRQKLKLKTKKHLYNKTINEIDEPTI
jgi:hypothetical protein